MEPTSSTLGKLGQCEIAHGAESAFLDAGVANDASAFIDLQLAGFELRFDERDEDSAWRKQRPNRWQDRFQRDERKIHDDYVELSSG